jgi:L,D-peptidoglycan transpeptidase YkuD (ErfK/YbiS/YcfS/YnhG family)
MGVRLVGVVCAIGALLTACGAATGQIDSASVPRSDDVGPAALLATGEDLKVADIEGPAAVELPGRPGTRPADRLEPYVVASTCDLVTASAVATKNGAGQYVIVKSSAWADVSAIVDVVIATRDPATGAVRLTCQRGGQAGLVGRTGMRPILDRRSGDGTTPAGIFPLGEVTAWDGEVFSFFGNSPDPGVRGRYRAVQPGDCWGATPGATTYNKLYRRLNCPGPDDEYLPNITGAYSHAAVIGANLGPEISGDAPGEPPYAAAIFLHRHAYTDSGLAKPTSGCVSLAIDDLVETLHLIDPTRQPRFVIGTTEWLRAGGAVV